MNKAKRRQHASGYFFEQKRIAVELFEETLLRKLLARCWGNVSAAACEAEMDRSNFLRLLRKHGIRREEFLRPEAA